MLSKDQASAVADAILSAEGARLAADRNASAPRVPFMYASEALSKLAPWEQAALLSRARRSALMGWNAGAFMAAWLLLVAAITLAFWPFRAGQYVWLVLPALALVAAQGRVLLVRARLQSLLLDALAKP